MSVRDNGLGIPPEHRQAIFQRSFRAHADLDDELGNEGFGMGLTIVQECLRELNGSIDVDSTPGEGSRFIVRLPLQILNNNPEQSVGVSARRLCPIP